MKDMSLLNEANMRDVEQCSITTEAHAAHQHHPELHTCMMHGATCGAEVSLRSDAQDAALRMRRTQRRNTQTQEYCYFLISSTGNWLHPLLLSSHLEHSHIMFNLGETSSLIYFLFPSSSCSAIWVSRYSKIPPSTWTISLPMTTQNNALLSHPCLPLTHLLALYHPASSCGP